MYQYHATATRSRRDLASNLGKTAFVLSKTTSVRVGSGLFEQTETLKGVGLRSSRSLLPEKKSEAPQPRMTFEKKSWMSCEGLGIQGFQTVPANPPVVPSVLRLSSTELRGLGTPGGG